MGYTHYWKRPQEFEAERFEAWTEDVRKIVDAVNGTEVTVTEVHYDHTTHEAIQFDRTVRLDICGGDGFAQPWITPLLVSLNGDATKFVDGDSLAHESFYIPKEGNMGGSFCKTARKPYDVVVVASLIRLAYHFPEGVDITSDGEPEDWEAGRQLAYKLFGVAVTPIGIHDW